MIKSILACYDHLIISVNGKADEYSAGIVKDLLVHDDELYIPIQTPDHKLMQALMTYRNRTASDIYSFAAKPPQCRRRMLGIYLTKSSNAINTIQSIHNLEDSYLVKDDVLARQLCTESVWLDDTYRVFTHLDLNKANWGILSNMESEITRERYFEWIEVVGREWFCTMHYYLDLKKLREYLSTPEEERDENGVAKLFVPYMPSPQLFFDIAQDGKLTHYATVATLLNKKEPLLIPRKVMKQFIEQPGVKFKPKLKVTRLPFFTNF